MTAPIWKVYGIGMEVLPDDMRHIACAYGWPLLLTYFLRHSRRCHFLPQLRCHGGSREIRSTKQGKTRAKKRTEISEEGMISLSSAILELLLAYIIYRPLCLV